MLAHYRAMAEVAAAPWPPPDAVDGYVGNGWYRALVHVEFTAETPEEVSVVAGEELLVHGDDNPAEGWVRAVSHAGTVGLVPATHVRLADFAVAAPAAHASLGPSDLSFAAGDELVVRPAARLVGRSWWLCTAVATGTVGYAPRHVLDESWGRIAALAVDAIAYAWRERRRGGGEKSDAAKAAAARRVSTMATTSAAGVNKIWGGGGKENGTAVVESGGEADAPAPPAAAAPWAAPAPPLDLLPVRAASRLAPPWRTPLAMDGLSLSADGRTATKSSSPGLADGAYGPRLCSGEHRYTLQVSCARRGAASVWIGFADAGGADANHDGTVDRAEFTAYGRAMVSVGAALARERCGVGGCG